MKPVTPMIGLDDLRNWLVSQGFRVELSGDIYNKCNWYAYRDTVIPARKCECNEGKPIVIFVNPWSSDLRSGPESFCGRVEVEVTGEFRGKWYKLQCYSLKPEELMAQFNEIEADLISAWNALGAGV